MPQTKNRLDLEDNEDDTDKLYYISNVIVLNGVLFVLFFPDLKRT